MYRYSTYHLKIMDPFQNPMTGNSSEGVNLLSVIINVVFGFVAGLMIFLGPKEVLAYGSKLAADLISLSGYGRQMAAFGMATTAAPFIVLAPIVGMVVRQLSSVRSLKGFGFFAAAVLVGMVAAFFSRGYFVELMGAVS